MNERKVSTNLINYLAFAALALMLSTAYLLDGPSELDAMRDTAQSVLDAQADAKQKASLDLADQVAAK